MTNGYGTGHGAEHQSAVERPKQVENEKRTEKPKEEKDAAAKR